MAYPTSLETPIRSHILIKNEKEGERKGRLKEMSKTHYQRDGRGQRGHLSVMEGQDRRVAAVDIPALHAVKYQASYH